MRIVTAVLALVALATMAVVRQAAAIDISPLETNVLPDDLATRLYRAERITVFRLDPNNCVVDAADGPGEKPAATVVAEPTEKADATAKLGVRGLENEGRFHGYKVVRSAAVDAPEKVVHLVRTMERSMADKPSPAKCFIPEYGIRFTVGDKSEELLLSLKCRQFSVKLPNDAEAMYVIADRPGNGGCRATLERLLDGAGDGIRR